MSKPAPARRGLQLHVKSRPLPFSFWPTYQGVKRPGIHSTIFALDPWTIINTSVKQHCPTAAKAEALAYVEQAKDFYTAAISASIAAARPLLLYYCFMNLSKALVVHRGTRPTITSAAHGLKERLRAPNREFEDAFVKAEKSTAGRAQVFDEFLKTIGTTGLATDFDYDLSKLLPQILSGHRLWCEAVNQEERFISLHEIHVMENKSAKTLWLNIYFFEDDLKRLGVTHKKLLSESRLGTCFRQVRTTKKMGERELICFEQTATVACRHRPSDEVHKLVAAVRPLLWVTIATIPPYRRYYAYLAPVADHASLLPQLLSIHAITFYLGSITRYRPHHFDKIVDGPFGPRVEEFISGQPLQFIYMMASEFAQREVTRPSIV